MAKGVVRPFRLLLTYRILLISACVAAFGLYCMYLGGEETKFWIAHKALRTLAGNLGGALLVSATLSIVWDLAGKRAFAREVLEGARLGADIEAAGIVRIGTSYLDDANWDHLFRGVSKLDIFVAYGQTWRNFNHARLQSVAKRSDGRIRVYLPDPDDAYTMTTLSARFDMALDELVRRVEQTRIEFEAMRVSGGAVIEVYYWAGDRVFSFYRFDGRAVITLYKHRRGRLSHVPTLVCEKGGDLYEFVREELDAVHSNSRRA